MDLCHLKNPELATHLQKYKGRVVLRGDNLEDEEGYRAVLTEQSASASQMAASRFLGAIAKTPVASDAISECYECRKLNAQQPGSEFRLGRDTTVGTQLMIPGSSGKKLGRCCWQKISNRFGKFLSANVDNIKMVGIKGKLEVNVRETKERH